MHKHGRNYYLSDIPLDEAIRKFDRALAGAGALRHTASESVPLDRANGRITAEPVWAERSSPHYDAAAMDGVAVRAADTVGASETSPLKLTVGDQAVWVDTGDPMPRDADAVIMVEDIQETDAETIEIYAPVSPYQHVRALGEDIAAAELVLPQSHKLRPHDLAACAAAGLTEVSVRVPPIVATIPTGSELAPIGETPKPGEIIEFNSLMLAAMVEDWGGTATRHAPVPDDFDLLVKAVSESVSESDIVIVNAGSSAGAEDYTAKVGIASRRVGGTRGGNQTRSSSRAGGRRVDAGAGDTGLPGVGGGDVREVSPPSDRADVGNAGRTARENPSRSEPEGTLLAGRGRVPPCSAWTGRG